MPYNLFKEIKVRCEFCKEIVFSNSETEWSECSCGSTKVIGKNSFVKIQGKKFTDLTVYNYDELPPHQH